MEFSDMTTDIPQHPDKDQPAAITMDELVDALMLGLRYDGKRRTHDADEIMSRLVAERLVRHLDRCGFVLTRRAARALPDTSQHRHPNAP